MNVITTERMPIKLWITDIEDGALEQAKNLANLPFVFKWVAIMPDSHQGYGMPIGGVLATQGVIIPNAVGVDIGCGMAAIKTDIQGITTESLKVVMGEVRKAIPVGFGHHALPKEWFGFNEAPDHIAIIQQELNSARKQLGTLGGGNHFIEFQKDEAGFLWVMLHSGSRNFGLKTANVYHKIAQELCAKWHVFLPDKDLAFLPADTEYGIEYFEAMTFCLKFAQASRAHMMQTISGIISEKLNGSRVDEVNIHHNYAAMENHFGTNVMVHRKGATRVQLGERGIIPGSMGTASYIVSGLGNPESFNSCSHGAGRKMGRKEAGRKLNLEEETAKMSGILHGLRNASDLDEAPGAYKDIDVVMENQRDLVKIETRLTPLGSIKG